MKTLNLLQALNFNIKLIYTLLIVSLLTLTNSVVWAEEKLTDQQLYELGRAAFYKDDILETFSHLFAYSQRYPQRMTADEEHKNQVLDAIRYTRILLRTKVGYGASVSGMPPPTPPKPTLKKLKNSNKFPSKNNVVNQPSKVSKLQLADNTSKKLDKLVVTFRSLKSNKIIYVDGHIYNDSPHHYPCIRITFNLRNRINKTISQFKVKVSNVVPYKNAYYRQKLPKNSGGFWLHSKTIC